MTVLVIGTVMTVLDSTIVNVALPEISASLDAGASIEWVVSSYLLAMAVALPVTGWLGARFGQKRSYLLALGLFTLASVACAASPSLPALVVARFFQGLGGGALLPIGLTIGLKMFPRAEHGRAVGLWGLAAMSAPAVGPTLGGWLVDAVNWHWLFLMNIPMGLFALFTGIRSIPEVEPERPGRFDTAGFVSGGTGLALVVLGLSEATRWGWGSVPTLGCLTIGVLLLVTFVVHELRIESPMLEVRIFADHTFSLSLGIAFFITAAQYARLVFVPLFLQEERGYTAFEVGLTLALPAIVTAAFMNVGGRWNDRAGPRPPVVVGVIFVAGAVLAVAMGGLGAPLWLLGILLVFQGVGVGLHMAPCTVAAMGTLRSDQIGQGSAMRNLAGVVAGAISVAGLGALLTVLMPADPTTQEAQQAYSGLFYVCFVGLLAALVMAWRMRPTAAGLDEDRRQEIDDAVHTAWE